MVGGLPASWTPKTPQILGNYCERTNLADMRFIGPGHTSYLPIHKSPASNHFITENGRTSDRYSAQQQETTLTPLRLLMAVADCKALPAEDNR